MIKANLAFCFKTPGLAKLLFGAVLCVVSSVGKSATAAETLATNTPPSVVPLPAVGSCAQLGFVNPSSPKWPLPLYLCHYSAAEFNALKAQSALDKSWLPNKQSYQGLADNLQDSRLPSIALAHGQRWYTMLAAEAATQHAVIQLTELISPYFGCALQITADGFFDPCVSAHWDRLGRLLAPVSDLPNQSLRQFPFTFQSGEVVLGEADTSLNWQLHAFEPDLQDASVPLFDRIGKGLFWGMVEEVAALWPLLSAQGELTENQQARLFIMAVSKQQAAAVRFLAEQGLNPQARTEFGDTALSVAKMIESEAMAQLLNELAESFESKAQQQLQYQAQE